MLSRRTAVLACLPLLAAACCLPPKKGAGPAEAQEPGAEGVIKPTPNGDCVLNVNPQNTLPGPTFSAGYDVDGGEEISGGKKSYTFEIDSQADTIQVGAAGGANRPTLTKGVAYAIRMNDFDGTPSAFVYEVNNPFSTQETVSVDEQDPDEYKTKTFTIAVEPYTSGGTDYARLVVTTGSNAVSIDVNETSP